jgi:hypothetical protein
MEFVIILSVASSLGLIFLLVELSKNKDIVSRELSDIYQILNQVSVIVKSQQEIINEQQRFINVLRTQMGQDVQIDDSLKPSTKVEYNLDDILDKISKNGLKSLSPEELDFLNNKNRS